MVNARLNFRLRRRLIVRVTCFGKALTTDLNERLYDARFSIYMYIQRTVTIEGSLYIHTYIHTHTE